MRTTVVAIILSLFSTGASYAGTPVRYDRLPEASRAFIGTNITRTNPVEIEIDRDDTGARIYEVEFADGTEIEFDAKGDWIKYDAADGYSVPATLIPRHISEYVTVNYPDRVIKQIKRSKNGYAIEITGDIDLYFTNQDPVPARPLLK